MLGLPLSLLVSRVLTLVIAFTVHEFAHAWTADRLGDPTPRNQGRLTLNPLVHLDLLGSLLLLIAGFGWAKPVPFNPHNLRNSPRMGTAIVAAAGPLSNLALAMLAALPLRFGLVSQGGATSRLIPSMPEFLNTFILINIILLFFNLIPLPPLDGHKVAVGVLPASLANPLERLSLYGPWVLILAFFFLPRVGVDIFDLLVLPPTQLLFSLLVG